MGELHTYQAIIHKVRPRKHYLYINTSIIIIPGLLKIYINKQLHAKAIDKRQRLGKKTIDKSENNYVDLLIGP